ncbi:MAG: hypothetical protein JSU86_06765 [Phycisphaerales bacterium]|nr:MAG: hypothetical protein JSU86_06765 [Phycisphaerales bacterium]
MSSETEKDLDPTLKRARDLSRQGFDWGYAWGKASLEHRIKKWPSGWGDDLQILIYGDFKAPKADLAFPELGIIVHTEKLENTVIRTALCVLKATIKISEKSVPSLIDAARRINVLLGTWTLVEWGNAGCGWWSYVTHGTGGGVGTTFEHEYLDRAIQGVLGLPVEVRQRVDAALYWVRQPRNLLMDFYRSDLLRVYSAYWNAFECLVEAVLILRPQQKLSKRENQQRIDGFLAQRNGKLTSADVAQCYQEIVNPGLVGKASHALTVCLGQQAAGYITDCFHLQDRQNRLYDIRNAINHGDIDAENPEELLRVESRLTKLWTIVWRMFGRLIPFPAPIEKAPGDKQAP